MSSCTPPAQSKHGRAVTLDTHMSAQNYCNNDLARRSGRGGRGRGEDAAQCIALSKQTAAAAALVTVWRFGRRRTAGDGEPDGAVSPAGRVAPRHPAGRSPDLAQQAELRLIPQHIHLLKSPETEFFKRERGAWEGTE